MQMIEFSRPMIINFDKNMRNEHHIMQETITEVCFSIFLVLKLSGDTVYNVNLVTLSYRRPYSQLNIFDLVAY